MSNYYAEYMELIILYVDCHRKIKNYQKEKNKVDRFFQFVLINKTSLDLF